MSYKSSYYFSNDTITGWGPRYFFSFYNKYGEKRSEITFEVSCFALIFLLSMVANVMTAAPVLKYPGMRTVSNCFLLNLIVADIAFISGIPVLIYTRLKQERELGYYTCKILPYSQLVSGFVALWTQTWISMDRYWCFVVPPFCSRLTPKRVGLLTAITWLIALIIFLPVTFWFREQTPVNNQSRICTLVFPKNEVVNILFLVSTLLLSCIIPLYMNICYNQRIYCKLKQTEKMWKKINQMKFVFIKPDIQRQWEKIRHNKYRRVIRMLLLNMVVLIMWLPINVIMFLIYVDGNRPNHDTNFFLRSHHFMWTLLIALLITVFNPLVHGGMSKSFRRRFLHYKFLAKQRKALRKAIFCEGEPVSSCSKTFSWM